MTGTSPRDRWLAWHPDKTAEDFGELIRRGQERHELAKLDGRTYMTDEERRRRAAERQRLCRKRKKEGTE